MNNMVYILVSAIDLYTELVDITGEVVLYGGVLIYTNCFEPFIFILKSVLYFLFDCDC
jgi:hypothetical protein